MAKTAIIPALVLMGTVLLACEQRPKLSRSFGNGAASAQGLFGLSVAVGKNQLDAYDYTFGSQSVQLDSRFATAPLRIERLTFVESATPISEDIKATLDGVCQDIGLSSSAQDFQEASSIPSDGIVYAHWRSHFSVEQKRKLSLALEQVKAPVRCLLKLQVPQGAGTLGGFIAFDPIPVATQKIAGTSKVPEAMDEGVMLIEQDTTLAIDQGQSWTTRGSAAIKSMVQALNSPDLTLKLNNTVGEGCRLHKLSGQTKIGNPTAVQSYEYSLEGQKEYMISSLATESMGGRALAACGQMKTESKGSAFVANVACGDYRAVQDEGLEAACAWAVEVANPKDPENTVLYSMGMEKISFETVDLSTVVGAASVIPVSPINPVTSKTTIFNGFSAAQLSSMEQSFDFWIAVSPKSYAQYFDKFITRVNYMGVTGPACSQQGVLAYVQNVGAREIFWCQTAGMGPAAIMNQNSPMAILLISVTAFHENLHSRGKEHDFAATNYEPCKGTAESALLAFDALKTCKEDFCLAFKDLSLREYKAELDYSLQGDNRRFQGQCQIWNSALGLTQADFRT